MSRATYARSGDVRAERLPSDSDQDEDRRRDDDGDRAPETPTDEPKPAPVQDPPAEPGRPPMVVRAGSDGSHSHEYHYD